jgi:hypothetical protein
MNKIILEVSLALLFIGALLVIRQLKIALTEKRLVATDPRFWGVSLHSTSCTYCKRKKHPLDFWSRTKSPKTLMSWLREMVRVSQLAGDPTQKALSRDLLARSKICPKCKSVHRKGAYPRTREGMMHRARTVKDNANTFRETCFLVDGIGNESQSMEVGSLSQLEAINQMNELSQHLIRSTLESIPEESL